MEIHCLAFGVIAVLRDAAAVGAKLIVGIDRAIARDKLNRFTRAEQALQAVDLVEKLRVNGRHFIGAKIAEKVVKFS